MHASIYGGCNSLTLENRLRVNDSVYDPQRISDYLVKEAGAMTQLQGETFLKTYVNVVKVTKELKLEF